MNADVVVMIVASGVVVISFGRMMWPIYRRHRTWEKKFDHVVGQIEEGIHNDDREKFKAGMEGLRELMGLPPDSNT